MRKNLKEILLLLIIMTAMCILTGCVAVGQNDSALPSEREDLSAEQSADMSDTNNEAPVNGGKQENDTKEEQEETVQSQTEDMQNQPAEEPLDTADYASDTSPDESAELCVFVESIGDNSVVGNKISIEPSSDGNNIVVMVGAGGDNKKLITIYFADDASYIYQIIRNKDVETSEGSFSDIGLNMILDLTGHYEGEDFYAHKVAISDVRTD